VSALATLREAPGKNGDAVFNKTASSNRRANCETRGIQAVIPYLKVSMSRPDNEHTSELDTHAKMIKVRGANGLVKSLCAMVI
jgi:hypothetical protein